MKFLKSGITFGSIGRTSLPTIRRRLASPDAETASYWPVRISVTISSDEPPYFALTLQPVAFVNGFTHRCFLLPSHAIRFSWPSVLPTFVIIESSLDELTPDAGTHNAAATAASSTCPLRILLIRALLVVPCRRCARDATRGAPACPWTRARRQTTSRGSVSPPSARPRNRARRCTA